MSQAFQQRLPLNVYTRAAIHKISDNVTTQRIEDESFFLDANSPITVGIDAQARERATIDLKMNITQDDIIDFLTNDLSFSVRTNRINPTQLFKRINDARRGTPIELENFLATYLADPLSHATFENAAKTLATSLGAQGAYEVVSSLKQDSIMPFMVPVDPGPIAALKSVMAYIRSSTEEDGNWLAEDVPEYLHAQVEVDAFERSRLSVLARHEDKLEHACAGTYAAFRFANKNRTNTALVWARVDEMKPEDRIAGTIPMKILSILAQGSEVDVEPGARFTFDTKGNRARGVSGDIDEDAVGFDLTDPKVTTQVLSVGNVLTEGVSPKDGIHCLEEVARSLGRLWWIANSESELQEKVAELTSKGARIIEVDRESERDVIHYVFELARDQAPLIMGYAPDDDEWLEGCDLDIQPFSVQTIKDR